MSGVYFVLNNDDSECWIDDSTCCIKDMRLVSAGLRNVNYFTYIIKTDNEIDTKALMEFVLAKVEDYHIDDNWYDVPGITIGYIIRQAEEHLEKNIFIPCNGEIFTFEKYNERETMRSTW